MRLISLENAQPSFLMSAHNNLKNGAYEHAIGNGNLQTFQSIRQSLVFTFLNVAQQSISVYNRLKYLLETQCHQRISWTSSWPLRHCHNLDTMALFSISIRIVYLVAFFMATRVLRTIYKVISLPRSLPNLLRILRSSSLTTTTQRPRSRHLSV